ncbi:MAG TPA: hypothetical protein VNJ08_14735 [Bacteriovoracaceae bacterium]|nr:hypothetical protein [Bacteriovoracaceae bacterium]
MKTILSFFSALLISSSLLAQTSILGSGMNPPTDRGSEVGSPPSGFGSSPGTTPTLNDSTINGTSEDQIQREEDTTTFGNGEHFGGTMGGANDNFGGSPGQTSTGVGTGIINDTGVGDPTKPVQ